MLRFIFLFVWVNARFWFKRAWLHKSNLITRATLVDLVPKILSIHQKKKSSPRFIYFLGKVRATNTLLKGPWWIYVRFFGTQLARLVFSIPKGDVQFIPIFEVKISIFVPNFTLYLSGLNRRQLPYFFQFVLKLSVYFIAS